MVLEGNKPKKPKTGLENQILEYLDPKHQNRGVGKELMKFIEKYFKNRKIDKFRLNVRCKNRKAFNFYKHLGYQEIAYIMTKDNK